MSKLVSGEEIQSLSTDYLKKRLAYDRETVQIHESKNPPTEESKKWAKRYRQQVSDIEQEINDREQEAILKRVHRLLGDSDGRGGLP